MVKREGKGESDREREGESVEYNDLRRLDAFLHIVANLNMKVIFYLSLV